jgi:hypothetical protein
MIVAVKLRRLMLAAVTGFALVAGAGGASIIAGALTPAQAQVSAEFQSALEPYGEWRRDARWGEVWVPEQRPRGWQPYSVGHWVYTDDWGWFWVSDNDEADWGWVTYHYGRWIFERRTGWIWIPGDEWAPAWVDWRRGDNYVGWAALAPDDVMYDYDADAAYWIFVEPRYMAAPSMRSYYLPPQRVSVVLRATVLVNRSFSVSRSGPRIAVNPGISPALIAAASHSAVPTFRVRPRVLASTQGVSGGVAVRPQDLRARGAPRGPSAAPVVSVQRTTTLIQPATSVAKPQPLTKGEPGRLGTHPPRAAQGGAPGGAPGAPGGAPGAPGAPGGPAPQQQQQQPASPPPAAGAPSRPEPRPGSPPPPPPPPPPSVAPALAPVRPAPPRPEPPRPAPPAEEHRDQRPPAPPEARPERPAPPQVPPPAQMAPRQAPPPPPVARPAPPPPPAVARPAPPPPQPGKSEPSRPGDKPGDKSDDKK